jgi:hypothetical protein
MSIVKFPSRRFRYDPRFPSRRPPPKIFIVPDGADGGCWAVNFSSDDGGCLLAKHFNLEDAIAAARAAARKYKAVFVDDNGGAR